MDGDTRPSEKRYRCDKCDGGFSHRKNLERHIRTMHADCDTTRYECPDKSCEFFRKGFARKDKLQLHRRRHHPSPTRAPTLSNPNSRYGLFRVHHTSVPPTTTTNIESAEENNMNPSLIPLTTDSSVINQTPGNISSPMAENS